jgi:NAD(P)-dependent dehydrogenase (short-subunit alcohol dehydrogenase family)
MRDLRGRTAFVTGGASGIGLGMARAFAASGMKVMLADVEGDALERAVAGLRDAGGDIRGVRCDVADRASVMRAAGEAVAAFGKVHVVCNNAGVGAGGPMEEIAPDDWNWVLGVNLNGVILGIEAFLPHIKGHGEGGHIVNTASMAGMVASPGMGPYCASKFAVVALSEALAAELNGTGIGVSVLCPGWVNTRITEARRNRPAGLGPGRAPKAAEGPIASYFAEQIRNGMDPDEVGRFVVDAIHGGDLYVFTHPEMRDAVEARFHRILAALDKSASVASAARKDR